MAAEGGTNALGAGAERMLLVRVGGAVLALPLAHVVEVAPSLPVTPVPGTPPGVRGYVRLRGRPTPVVALGAGPSGRLVVVRDGPEAVAVEVEAVLGLASLRPDGLRPVPAAWREVLATGLGLLDGAPLAVLDAARLVPPELAAGLRLARRAGEEAVDAGRA